MSFAISVGVIRNAECCQRVEDDSRGKICCGAIISDLALVATTLTLGILALLGKMHLPPIAGYSLVGVGAAIFLADVLFIIITLTCCEPRQASRVTRRSMQLDDMGRPPSDASEGMNFDNIDRDSALYRRPLFQ